MSFFLRLVGLFLVIFIGLSVIIKHVFFPSPSENQITMPSSLTMALPPSSVRMHNTKTGLLLAGQAAQNNRDWAQAQTNFLTLIDTFDGGATMHLKAMTLSLGAGDESQALTMASKINTAYFTDENFKDDGETFDLARLLLIAKNAKSGEIEKAQSFLKDLHRGALTFFTKPMIEVVLNAGITDYKFDSKTPNMSALQMVYKALAAELAGQSETAEKLFDRVAQQKITPQTSEMIAAFYMRQDETSKAIDVLRRARLSFPDDTELEDTLSTLKDTPENYEAPAFSDYHRTSVPALLSMAFHDFARVMMAERASDSALLFARMAAYTDPKSPGIWMSIGDITAAQKQYDDALDAYRKIPSNDVDYLTAQIEISDILRDQNKTDEAIDFIEEILETPDNQRADMYLTLGNLYKMHGDYDDAIEAYDIAETKGLEEENGEAPDWLWFLHYFRGVCFDLMDRHGDAEKDLLRAVEARPNNATLLNYLGYSYADKGQNLDKAKDMIERAVQQNPDDAHIVDSMGWVLYRMDDYEGAVKYLERAAKLMPYHAVINDHLGDAYWKVGRKIEAHYMWQRAVDYTNNKAAQGIDASEEEQNNAARNAAEKLKTGLVD